MPRAALSICLMVLCASPLFAQMPRSPADPLPPGELEAFVDGVIADAMASEHIAGAAVSIVQDGRIVLKKGYGHADVAAGLRVDPDTTLFRIGSITKTFTWIVVMNAVERGQMTLDDPINTHLPPDLQIPEEGFTEPIRIRHLMTHTPGFEDRIFGHLFERQFADVRPLSAYLRDERPLRVREPGRLSSYSNYGVALVGAALEKIHGRSWQDIIATEILAPLRMRHTRVREPDSAGGALPAPSSDESNAQLSNGYRWTGFDYEAQPFEYIGHVAPAGVISSTAGDMARYMMALLNDGSLDDERIFGPAAARAFRTPMTSLPSRVGNWNAGFLEAPLTPSYRSVGHDGGSLLFFSSMVLVPPLRLGVFITTNTAGGDRLSGPFAARVVEQFYESGRTPTAAPDPKLAVSRADYDGYYAQTRRPYTGLQAFFFRLFARRVVVTTDGYLTAPLLGQAQRFVPSDRPDEFKAADADGALPGIRITRDAATTRIEAPLMAWERVPLLMQPPVLVFTGALTIVVAVVTLVRTRRASFMRRAATLHVVTAALWLTSAAALAFFALALSDDESTLVYDWPTPAVLTFSAVALLATTCSVAMLAMLPSTWQQSKERWALAQSLGYAVSAIVFTSCGALLAWWGALQPWKP
jgi:CubicO group peptidase (beta-lactamase class C family)